MEKCKNCGRNLSQNYKYLKSKKTFLCLICFNKKNKIAEKNQNWSGDKVGYKGLHQWVRKRIPKPKLCQMCRKKPPIDLANKGIYDRDLKNWEWLCRKCHMTGDGRIKKNLKQYAKK